MEKVCKGCGFSKEINEFPRDNGKKDGYKNSCKTCRKKSVKYGRTAPVYPDYKICIMCQATKPIVEFPKWRGSKKRGYNTRCIQCSKKYAIELQNQKPKGLHLANVKRHYHKHKDKIAVTKRKYRQANVEKIKKWNLNRTEILSDSYIKGLLKRYGFSAALSQDNPNLIELYRTLLKIKRYVKESKTRNQPPGA